MSASPDRTLAPQALPKPESRSPKAEAALPSGRWLSYRSDKPIQESPDLAALLQQFLALRFIKESKVHGDSYLSLDLENRTTSNRKKLTQFTIGKATLAFGNIAGHGYSRPSELAGKAEHLFTREVRGIPVDF